MGFSSISSHLLPPHIPMIVLILLSCFISTSFSFRVISDHKPNTKPLGFTARLMHRDSLESPFYDPNLTDSDRLRNSIQRSYDRYNYYTSNTMVPNDMRAQVSYRTSQYVISHYIGTPPVPTYSLIDTGSDLTWLQCIPCDNCYRQILPIFDPSKSSSYAKVGCEDDMCKQEYGTTCDKDGTFCRYQRRYADGGQSQGILSSETFIFQDDGRTGNISIPNLPFGCGHNTIFSSTNSSLPRAPGLIGLSREPLSWISRLSFEHFSHCFVSKIAKQTSLLRFGSDAIITPDTTPMVDHTNGFYYVILEGISVGDTKLNIPYGAFNISTSGSRGVVIDTGAATTHLVKSAHDPMIAELEKQITLERAAPLGRLSLCYKATMTSQILMSTPYITFHFTGLDFYLQKLNLWIFLPNGTACLTLVEAMSDLTVIGAQHLQDVNVGYDLRRKVISLLSKDCTNN